MCLFLRKISFNLLALLVILLVSASLFYSLQAWPGATFMDCCVRTLYMLTLESVEAPRPWYLELLIFFLPAAGLIILAEGLVSAIVLFVNRHQRLGEWSAVLASTYENHVVICGLGQLGGTLCEGLLDAGYRVVAVELDDNLPAVVTARRRGAPVIIGDMTRPETLDEANVAKARCVVVCSGDDLANIETAIMAQETNPHALVFARVFKKSLADKINAALRYNIYTFSPYAAAAASILQQITAESAPRSAVAESPQEAARKKQD